jgi:SWI/SNF-related matrix-associated actin-dependent regulator 1 of chromatin subfamily A
MDAKNTMRPFQLFGMNWMKVLYNHKFGCILADEMGLGKTCQVISLLAHLVESYNEDDVSPRPWPNLIVVPPSTLSNWEGEFEKFAPELSVLTYRGSQTDRQEIAEEMLENPHEYHVVLTSYTQIGKEEDIDAMRELKPNAAIFDEGHKMKNMQTKVYRDLVRIKANWRMLLTGTPVQNNLKEMLALLNFIDPGLFKAHLSELDFIFGQKVTTRDVNNGAFLYSARISRARNILEPFILQRRKDQVLDDMPKKICNVVYCDLIDSQKELYNRYEALFKNPVKVRADGRQNDQNNPWIQLRKAAIHPQLFRRHFTDEKVNKMAKVLMAKVPQSELQQPELRHLVGELKNCSDFELHLWCRDYPCIRDFDIADGSWLESGKVVKMLELIHQYQQNGDRVLVFSKFAKVIDILREVLHTDGIDHCVLQGATSVDERQGLIDDFNNNTDKTVFLLTTGAGGTGINLTSANKVIIFDQSDNPQDDIQAENRAHRLGQTRDVEIIRLLTRDTIEELIYKACSKKIELANKVTGVTVEEMSGKDAEVTLEKEVRKLMADKPTP